METWGMQGNPSNKLVAPLLFRPGLLSYKKGPNKTPAAVTASPRCPVVLIHFCF